MRFAAKIPQMGPMINGPDVLRFAREAERLGFDMLSVGDHVVFPEKIEAAYPYGGGERNASESAGNYLEPLTLLTWVAAATQRVDLLTGVIIAPYRHPVLAAKMLSCLDFLSQGRLVVGVGVGWLAEEFEVLGARFDRRGAVTDEIIDIWRKLWTEESPSHAGQYYQFAPVRFTPKPVRRPRLPVWIAGNAAAAIRRAARTGDGWFPIHFAPDELRPLLADLRAQCEAAGRAPDSVEICLGTSLEFVDESIPTDLQRRLLGEGIAERMVEELNAFAEMGVGTIQFDFRTRDVDRRLAQMQRFMAEVKPHLAP